LKKKGTFFLVVFFFSTSLVSFPDFWGTFPILGSQGQIPNKSDETK
jgi:hypothetical protein